MDKGQAGWGGGGAVQCTMQLPCVIGSYTCFGRVDFYFTRPSFHFPRVKIHFNKCLTIYSDIFHSDEILVTSFTDVTFSIGKYEKYSVASTVTSQHTTDLQIENYSAQPSEARSLLLMSCCDVGPAMHVSLIDKGTFLSLPLSLTRGQRPTEVNCCLLSLSLSDLIFSIKNR